MITRINALPSPATKGIFNGTEIFLLLLFHSKLLNYKFIFMKKPKIISTTNKPAKKAASSRNNAGTSMNPSEQDFGGLEKNRNNDTETRKNVNADPNLIQGNKLNETKNSNTMDE